MKTYSVPVPPETQGKQYGLKWLRIVLKLQKLKYTEEDYTVKVRGDKQYMTRAFFTLKAGR